MEISSSQLQAARERIQRIKDLQQQHSGTFPSNVRQELVEQFSSLEFLFTALSQGAPPSPTAVAAAVLDGITTQEVLWSAIVALEERLSKLEDQLQSFRIDQQELEGQLQSFRIDHQKLVLRQVGSQLENKLARRCIPDIITPYAARHTTFNRIKSHKGRDEAYVLQLKSSFPDLEAGIEALNELAVPVAHPERMKMEPGPDVPITFGLLESLTLTHFDGSDALEPVQQVLACLKAVSEELAEPPFVDTNRPQVAAGVTRVQ